MWKFVAAAIVLVLTTGCATRVSSGWQAVHAVQLDVSTNERRPYFLLDWNRQQLASAVPVGGRLTFQLPAQRHVTDCANVVDQNGKSILGGDQMLSLSARSDYVRTLLGRQSLYSQWSQESMRSRAADAEYANASARLKSNRAFSGSSCSRPPALSNGARPVTRCSTHGECFRDAKLICYSKFVGAKGCGMVASEFNIPNIVSGPTCAAAVAELAGDKYQLEDAFIDFLFGLADDTAANLRKSENSSDVFLGWIITGISGALQIQQADACTKTFVDRQLGPLQRWLQEGERLRAEPDTLLQACTRDVSAMSTALPFVGSNNNRLSSLKDGIDKADARLNQIAREQRPLEWCSR